jgi:hypothetical protein
MLLAKRSRSSLRTFNGWAEKQSTLDNTQKAKNERF